MVKDKRYMRVWIVVIAMMMMGMVNARFKSIYDKQNHDNHPPASLTSPVYFFEQKLDQYDPIDKRTWKQRYTVDTSSALSNVSSPVFFFLSGEAPMEFFEFQEVQAKAWAHHFNATYIVLEHRFYGKSVPTSDFSSDNLRYLTSRQALADAAYFIEYMQETYKGPWVVFGCSYSAGLSSWLRSKYPHLVVASVAPSGPVQATLNFSGYYGQFSKSAEKNCVEAAKNATQQIMLLLSSPDGLSKVSKIFRACEEIKEEDVYMFKYTITSALGGADQMNNPPDWTLNATCDMLTQSSPDLVSNWAAIVLNGTDDCMDYSINSFISSLQSTATENQTGDRAWTWQTCVEFGYFATSYKDTSVFFPDLDVETQISWCSEIFGITNMSPDISGTNDYYGGFNLTGTNIMFTNGELDPWHLLSITHSSSDPDSSILSSTYSAGHCGTLIESSSADPSSLIETREMVREFLSSVLPK